VSQCRSIFATHIDAITTILTQFTVAIGILSGGAHFDYATSPVNKAFIPTPTPAIVDPVISKPTPAKARTVSGCSLEYIKSKESGGRYTATNKSGSSASGAYQYLDSTWNGYGGYKRAKDAPPSVQDQRAASDHAAGKQSQWSVCK